MNAHKNMSRLDVLRHGPEKIAKMAASEFYRAANRASQPDSVRACLARGRELMGILETQRLPEPAAKRLKPIFARASQHQLDGEVPAKTFVKIASEIAYELERPFAA